MTYLDDYLVTFIISIVHWCGLRRDNTDVSAPVPLQIPHYKEQQNIGLIMDITKIRNKKSLEVESIKPFHMCNNHLQLGFKS